jgi:AbiV family abortive infection protein
MNRQAVLLGSVYALQQAGLLLEDAVILFDRGRRATAAGLALFAREEIGRHRILKKVWSDMAPDALKPAKEINKCCQDHVTKHREAQRSYVLRADTAQLEELLQSQMKGGPQAVRNGRPRLDAIRAQREKRAPTDRARFRETSFYVDAIDERHWSVPSLCDPVKCANDLADATTEYFQALVCLSNPPAFADSFGALTHRPILPSPPRCSSLEPRVAATTKHRNKDGTNA